jgi:hypothetical protein
MWEKIKANWSYIYLGVIVFSYFGYVLYIEGFSEVVLGYFREADHYKVNGVNFYFYSQFIRMVLFGALFLVGHLYFTGSKHFNNVVQILILLFVIFLIFLKKNLG